MSNVTQEMLEASVKARDEFIKGYVGSGCELSRVWDKAIEWLLDYGKEDKKPDEGGWVGFDLDGTIAEFYGWDGIESIGEPIGTMIRLMRSYLDKGVTVKIVTARAHESGAVPHIHAWLEQQGLPKLEVTATKDYNMLTCYDDRAKQVVPNKGILLEDVLTDTLSFISAVELIRLTERGGLEMFHSMQNLAADMLHRISTEYGCNPRSICGTIPE